VLVDAGRTAALRDPIGRQALHCIRCSACLNVCPVYERTGGHAYESVYPGPIGAILTPQLTDLETGTTLPWASSLCGACYDACPVKIDIPTVLVHLRNRIVREGSGGKRGERVAMGAASGVLRRPRSYRLAQRAGAPLGRWLAARPRLAGVLPGAVGAWASVRDLPSPPEETFAQWWNNQSHDRE
jgi:L-lactate dehydrogenase complex protein LldF